MFTNTGGWKLGTPAPISTLKSLKCYHNQNVQRFFSKIGKEAKAAGESQVQSQEGLGETARASNSMTDSIVIFATNAKDLKEFKPVMTLVDDTSLLDDSEWIGCSLRDRGTHMFLTRNYDGLNSTMTEWDTYVNDLDKSSREEMGDPCTFARAFSAEILLQLLGRDQHPIFGGPTGNCAAAVADLVIRSPRPYIKPWPRAISLSTTEGHFPLAFAQLIHFLASSLGTVGKQTVMWFVKDAWLEDMRQALLRILALLSVGHKDWTFIVVNESASPRDLAASFKPTCVDVTGTVLPHWPASNAYIREGFPLSKATFKTKLSAEEKKEYKLRVSSHWKQLFQKKLKDWQDKKKAGVPLGKAEFDEQAEDVMHEVEPESHEEGDIVPEEGEAEEYEEEIDDEEVFVEEEAEEETEEEEELQLPPAPRARTPAKPKVSAAALPAVSQAVSSTGQLASEVPDSPAKRTRSRSVPGKGTGPRTLGARKKRKV